MILYDKLAAKRNIALDLPFWDYTLGNAGRIIDRSKNHHVGSITGATQAATGRSFAVDDFISIPDHASLKPTTFTLIMWATLGGQLASIQEFLNKVPVAGNAGYNIRRPSNSDYIDGYIQNAAAYKVLRITVATPSVVHRFTFTYDGTTLGAMLDGVAQTPVSAPSTLAYDTTALYFGKTIANENYLTGTIHAVELVPRVLSVAEDLLAYNVEKWRFGL